MSEIKEEIEISNLGFSFVKTPILNNISLNIKRGEFLSILGSSGSGKSTLLRLVSNILPQNKKDQLTGKLAIFGKSTNEYIETGKLSFMFQEPSLMPNLDVKNNIYFPLKLRGTKVDHNLIEELLEVVGLKEHQYKYPSELSGGMKTRVSLARAFVTKPEVLLLDEPFSALDISWKYDLYEYLYSISKKFNTTVIIVTHDIQEAVLLGDNITVLSKKGTILSSRKPIKKNAMSFGYENVNKVLKENFEIILGLQNDILQDANKNLQNVDFKKNIVDIKIAIDNNKENNKLIFDKIYQLRPIKDTKEIQDSIYSFWKQSNSREFKFEAIWFLLDYKKASEIVHQDVFNFLVKNKEFVIHYGQNQEYFRESELIFKTNERINSTDYPETKNWLYLVFALLMSENKNKLRFRVLQFIEEFLSNNEVSNKQYVMFFLNQANEE